jgi:DNA polymerase I
MRRKKERLTIPFHKWGNGESPQDLIDRWKEKLFPVKTIPDDVRLCRSFHDFIAFDIETTGFNPRSNEMFSYSMCDMSGNAHVYRTPGTRKRHWRKPIEQLQDFLSSETKIPIVHNALFEWYFLGYKYQIRPIYRYFHDTIIMSRICMSNARSHALKDLSFDLAGWDTDVDDQVEKHGIGGYHLIDRDLFDTYQIYDVQRTILLFQLFYNEIASSDKLIEEYIINLMMVWVCIDMRSRGMYLDREGTENLKQTLIDGVSGAEIDFYKEYGSRINLGSTKQVSKALYTDMKYPVKKKTKSGANSTGKDTIQLLSEEFPDDIVIDALRRYRTYKTALGYIKQYEESGQLLEDNAVHSQLDPNGARATGRFNSTNPNMQNVGSGKSKDNKYSVKLRKCFKARPGYKMYLIDYSGIELRLAADHCNDTNMIGIINRDENGHEVYATCMFPNYPTMEKSEQEKTYKACKNGHFGMIYGAGKNKLMNTLSLKSYAVESGLNRYAQDHLPLRYFADSAIKAVEEVGYVKTIFDRKLWVNPEMAYEGSNYIIQGTAAGVLKRGLYAVWVYTLNNPDLGINLLLTIHDEIIFEIPLNIVINKRREKKIISDIMKLMTGINHIRVKLDVEAECTISTWNDVKDFKID